MTLKLSPLSLGLVHFIGIGGIGMSGLAQILHNMGQSVQGSDSHLTPNVRRLMEAGIHVTIGHHAANITNADSVVVSTAIKPDNIELVAARERGLPIIHRADLLTQLMRLKWSIAVAGSHGKTSTTSLMAHLLETAGLDPTVINGGIINAYGSNARLGQGDWIVAEADESDGSFTKIFPTIAVVTNIDEEHMDHYPDFDAVKNAYKQFLDNLPFFGIAVLGIDHPDVHALASQIASSQLITYGFHEEAQVKAQDIRFNGDGMIFSATVSSSHPTSSMPSNVHKDIRLENLHLKMLGIHNVQNALAVLAVAFKLMIPADVIRRAFTTFQGVKRRLTLVGHVQGAPIYDDYAHHPQEIEAVLKTLAMVKENVTLSPSHGSKEVPSATHLPPRIISVFQPHRYSRLAHLFREFSRAFYLSDKTYILPVYAAGEDPDPAADAAALARSIASHNTKPSQTVQHVPDHEALFSLLKDTLHPTDIVAFMGAGSITLMVSDFVNQLGVHHAA